MTGPRRVVEVPLEVLDSILASAVQGAVRHACGGLSENARAVLWNRQTEIEALATAKVHAALAASGYVKTEGD